MPLEDGYAGAEAFLAKLGFVGAAMDDLLVGVITTDDGLPVPAQVKKVWQKWNLTGHPDKQGDKDVYNAMKAEYTAFKREFEAWQKAHPTGQPDFQTFSRASMPASRGPHAASKQRAELKEQAARALEAVQKALEEGRYEDAKAHGATAVRLFDECQSISKSKVTDQGIRDSICQARALIVQAEEGVRRVQEEAQKRRSQEEAMEGLDGLWRSVCAGIADRDLGWAQKATALQERFEDEKRKIEVLNTKLCEEKKVRAEMELKAHEAEDLAMKYKVELEGARTNVQKVSGERDRLTDENTKLNEELEECRRAFDKEESASSGLFGFLWPKQQKQKISPSQMIGTLKSTLRQATQEVKQKEAQMEILQNSCNQKDAKLRETETRLKQATAECKQQEQAQNNTLQKLQHTSDELENLKLLKSAFCAVLDHIMPDMAECLAIARELEAYTEMTKREFTEMQRKCSSQPAKFKVYHDEASDSGWRVIECNHESPDMFKELALCVRERFELANEVLFFQYKDNDGDTISVHNSIELKEAMGHFAPSYCTKLTWHQKKAPNKVMAQAGLPTEKAKDEDVHDEL